MKEEEIIEAICSTVREQNRALEQLYRYKGAEFKRYFHFKGIPTDSCEDVLQEVILKTFNGAKNYRGTGGYSENSANAWMWTIARNCMNDHLNREKFSQANKEKLETCNKLMRDKALNAGISIGDKTVFPYIEPIHESPQFSGGSLNDDDWIKKHGGEIYDSEVSLLQNASIRKNQLDIDLCVSNGIEDFCAEHPDRAAVLMMQIDGESIESIARRINRKTSATKEYISQCKIKLKPFIEHCKTLIIN